MRGYIPPVSEKEKILQRRIEQAVQDARLKGAGSFIGFLSLREQQLALASLNKFGSTSYTLDGGHKNAERAMLCVFDNVVPKKFPFVCIKIKVQQNRGLPPLSHKDYLGALLAIGLQRECFGDIIVGESSAFVFVTGKVASFVLQELQAVGKNKVVLAQEAELVSEENTLPEKQQQVANVASLRLDVVLSAVCKISRKDAVAYIEKGLVQINNIEASSVSGVLYEADIFSVRGLGKFSLSTIGGKSRKKPFVYKLY